MYIRSKDTKHRPSFGADNSHYEKFADGTVHCIDEEIPFEIPENWCWCRVKNVIKETNAGKSPNCEKRPKSDNEWGVLTTTAVQYCYFLPNENKVLSPNYTVNSEHAVSIEDILITRAGPRNRTGIVCVVDKPCDNLILSDKTVRIEHIREMMNPYYLMYTLNSPSIHELVMSATVGMADSQVNISQASIQNILIPLPPLAEQQRIVAKLEEVLPVVDRYNKAQSELDSLNDSIKDLLKKSILQEAIQGRLVPQLDREEPATELLKRIAKEKQELLKQGKLKAKDITSSTIFRSDDNRYYEKIGKENVDITDSIPFEIPDSWRWVRIGDIFAHNNGKQLNKGNLSGKMMEYITTSNLYWDGFILQNLKRMPFAENEEERFQAIKGDLLVCEGGDVGRSCIWNYDFPIMLQNHIHKLRAYTTICTKYFYYTFYFYNLIGIIGGKGIGIQGFSSKALHNTLVPVPPIEEQQRIASKVEKLFTTIK